MSALQRPAVNPFIAQQAPDLGSELTVKVPVGGVAPAGQVNQILLLDPRGGVYATSGVLPREKITLPHEQIRAALANLQAAFSVGPLLAITDAGVEKAAIPPIDLKGYRSTFIRQPFNGPIDQIPVPKVPPTAELPESRATVARGWMLVSPTKANS